MQKFNTPGFIGCLADVRFNNITPIRDIFRNPKASEVITVKGSLVESNCGAMPLKVYHYPYELDPWYMGTGKHEKLLKNSTVMSSFQSNFFLLLIKNNQKLNRLLPCVLFFKHSQSGQGGELG